MTSQLSVSWLTGKRHIIDPLTRILFGDGCWLWTGPLDKRGYARHGAPLVHIMTFTKFRGPVPPGLELDHLCRVPRCVNPDHLEPVTHAENVRRGRAGEVNRARMVAKTMCKRGHEFTAENTGRDHRGDRFCQTCTKMLHKSYYHANIEVSRKRGREKARLRHQKQVSQRRLDNG